MKIKKNMSDVVNKWKKEDMEIGTKPQVVQKKDKDEDYLFVLKIGRMNSNSSNLLNVAELVLWFVLSALVIFSL